MRHKLSGQTIAVRRARAAEKLLALDDNTYELLPSDLVIADARGPVAIAGVMGGRPTGVTETTTEIVLESAWFEPATVRRTSRRLGLISDSSYRYERRVDPGALIQARDRAVALLQELCGATVVAQPASAGAPPISNGPIRLSYDRIKGLLGIEIPKATIVDNLTRLGCVEISRADDHSVWSPPSFRHDLFREVDLIEEVARLHGLDDVPGRVVTSAQTESAADRAHDRLARVRRVLAARGWDECLTDTLVEQRFADGALALAMENPLSELQTHLRSSLKASLLQVASRNLSRGAAQLRLFEAGRVFEKSEGTTREPLRLGFVAAGVGAAANWDRLERATDYFDLSGMTEFLIRHAGFEAGDILESGSAFAGGGEAARNQNRFILRGNRSRGMVETSTPAGALRTGDNFPAHRPRSGRGCAKVRLAGAGGGDYPPGEGAGPGERATLRFVPGSEG